MMWLPLFRWPPIRRASSPGIQPAIIGECKGGKGRAGLQSAPKSSAGRSMESYTGMEGRLVTLRFVMALVLGACAAGVPAQEKKAGPAAKAGPDSKRFDDGGPAVKKGDPWGRLPDKPIAKWRKQL